MKIRIGKHVFKLRKTRRWWGRGFAQGRLYRGFVGLSWTTRLFDLDVWLYRPQKETNKNT